MHVGAASSSWAATECQFAKLTLYLDMAQNEDRQLETSILPLKYVDIIEDIFHAVLAIALFVIGIGAFILA